MFADGIIHLAYAILLSIDASFLEDSRDSKWVTLIVSVLLSTKEFYQMKINGVFNYFTDYYNWMDIMGEFLYVFYAFKYLYAEDG